MEVMVALIPTGDPIETETGLNRLGKDTDGNDVVVSASSDVVKVHGWSTVWESAEIKYARDEFESTDAKRVIKVITADCEALEADDEDDV
jgi:hypothetical protein